MSDKQFCRVEFRIDGLDDLKRFYRFIKARVKRGESVRVFLYMDLTMEQRGWFKSKYPNVRILYGSFLKRDRLENRLEMTE